MLTQQPARQAPIFPGAGVFGSLKSFRHDPLKLLMRGFREMGDVVRFRVFTRFLVLVAHPDHARRVLQDRATAYNKQTPGFAVLRDLLRDGLLTSEGEHWLRQRRIAQPAFHQSRIAKFGNTMTTAATTLVDTWLRGSPKTVNVTANMLSLTLQIVGETLLSTDVSRQTESVGQALSIAQRQGNEAINRVIPRPHWWPSAANRQLQSAIRTLDRVILDIITARRAGADQEDLLAMLMQAQDEQTGEGMSNAQLRDEVMTVLLAGHETTAIALGWTWYLLSRHPTVRERLHAEVDTALTGRLPNVTDLPNLSYVHQVVKESMRLYPPAWIVSRCAENEDLLGGFRIPAGTIVLVSPFVTHRHPEYWVNPNVFDPDRFESTSEAKRPPFAYLPFGGGPRQCIGNTFALMELVLVVSTIAQRCQLDLEPGDEVNPSPLITLRAARPIRMRVSPRAPAPV